MCDVKRDGNAQRKRVTSSVDIDAGERRAINDFAARFGGKGMQKRILTLLIQWFARQPESVKQAVLGWTPDDMSVEYAMVLRALADDLESGSTPAPESVDEVTVGLASPAGTRVRKMRVGSGPAEPARPPRSADAVR